MTMKSKSRAAKAELLKRRSGSPERPLVLASDLAVTMLLGLSVPVLTLLPELAINPAVKALARLLPATLRQGASPALISRVLDLSDEEAHRIFRNQLEARLQSIAWFIRQMVRGRAYDLEIEGAEHVDQALAQGKGVVIWIADLVFCSEGVRQALHRMGHPSTHMSRPEHGFSQSEFGVKALNPVRTKVENRFLRERIIFDRKAPAAAVHRMNARLKENGVVSMVACADEGTSLIEAPFMTGKTMLASGALRLGFTAGCPVLPAFTVPWRAPPRFKTIIGAPLTMTSPKRDEALLEAAGDFLRRLEPIVRADPHLWRGWPSLIENEPIVVKNAGGVARLEGLPAIGPVHL